jgi:hypothetical protein
MVAPVSAVGPAPASSSAALSACRDLIFEALVDVCDRAASYARSASEAAWRGDEHTVSVHARQLRDCVVEAIKLRNELAAQNGNRGAP